MTTQLISLRKHQNTDGELKAQKTVMTHMDMVTGDGDSVNPRLSIRKFKHVLLIWKLSGHAWRLRELLEWLLPTLNSRAFSQLLSVNLMMLLLSSKLLWKLTSTT